jgi:hypothetical protein
MRGKRRFDDRFVQWPCPGLAVETPGVGELLRIGGRQLRRDQSVVAFEIELLEDHRGANARTGDGSDQSRANDVVRGIIVDFAEEPIACASECRNQLLLGNEPCGSNVPDSRLGCSSFDRLR